MLRGLIKKSERDTEIKRNRDKIEVERENKKRDKTWFDS